MRFTLKGGSFDVAKAEKEVLRAIELGVNYFDTAYLYVGNEACLGEILSRNHLRKKVHIATKLPQYKIASAEAIESCFQEELRRLQTDYIDYYLMHMLTDIASWERLEKLGIRDWIARKKQEGAIRQIGFSFHGNTEMFLKILNAMTGISVRFSTITWTKMLRQAGRACGLRQRRESRSSSWSRCGAGGWWSCCRKKPGR